MRYVWIAAAAVTLAIVFGVAVVVLVRAAQARRRVRNVVSWTLLVLVAVVAPVLLFEAVVLLDVFERPVRWLVEDVLRLGEKAADKAQAVAWIRWILLAIVLVLLGLLRTLGRAAWIDVVAISAVLLISYSAWRAREESKNAINTMPTVVGHPAPGRAQLDFAATKLADPLSDYRSGEDATLVLVLPRRNEEQEIVGRTAVRHLVRLRTKLKPKGNSGSVTVEVVRGADDVNTIAVTRDVNAAERVYVFPAP